MPSNLLARENIYAWLLTLLGHLTHVYAAVILHTCLYLELDLHKTTIRGKKRIVFISDNGGYKKTQFLLMLLDLHFSSTDFILSIASCLDSWMPLLSLKMCFELHLGSEQYNV